MIKYLIGLLLFVSTPALALPILGDQWFEVGPQISHWHLKGNNLPKNGNGFLYGAYYKYDRLNGNSLYWGAEGSFSQGTIRYSSPKIQSTLSQRDIQGKLGITLNVPLCYDIFYFSPFIGIGDSKQKESFSSAPNLYEHYTFLSAGFQSRLNFLDLVSIGVNFQIHGTWFFFPWIKQMQLETPIQVGEYSLYCASVGLHFTPFYQYRENFLRHSKHPQSLHLSPITANTIGVRLGLFVYF